MEAKRVIFICMGVGAWAGSLIPQLWGSGALSMGGVFCSAFGASVGIWVGFKITR